MTCDCYNLGIVDVCGGVALPYVIQNFDVTIYFTDGLRHSSVDIASGDTIAIPRDLLNEDRVYTGWVNRTSNGARVFFTIDDEMIECVTFKTIKIIDV